MDECRGGARWYVRPGYCPRTDTERVAVLQAIQERCSLEQVAVEEARAIVRLLPAESAGRCVLDERGHLQRATPAALQRAPEADRLRFHEGRIRGVCCPLATGGGPLTQIIQPWMERRLNLASILRPSVGDGFVRVPG